MKVLAIDSSGNVASVAIMEDDNLIAEYTLNYKTTHSETLLPMIDEIMKLSHTDTDSFDGICIAKGPGSFTGLRIGASTAKGLGMVWKVPVIGVPTVMGLAYNLYKTDCLVCPIMDARRNQVYTGIFDFSSTANGTGLNTIMSQVPMAIEDLIEKLNGLGKEVVFIGDGVPVFAEEIENKIKVKFSFAPAHLSRQRAGAVAALGLEAMKSGAFDGIDITDAAAFAPEYLRLSQAERERMEKNEH